MYSFKSLLFVQERENSNRSPISSIACFIGFILCDVNPLFVEGALLYCFSHIYIWTQVNTFIKSDTAQNLCCPQEPSPISTWVLQQYKDSA